MKKLKGLAILTISILGITNCAAQPSLKDILRGVWFTNPSPPQVVAKDFSWGRGRIVVNGSIEIDALGQNEMIFLPGMGGPFRITQLSWIDKDAFLLSFFFERGNFQVDYKIHYSHENGTIWFEDLKNSNFILSSPSNLWYKISGPERK